MPVRKSLTQAFLSIRLSNNEQTIKVLNEAIDEANKDTEDFKNFEKELADTGTVKNFESRSDFDLNGFIQMSLANGPLTKQKLASVMNAFMPNGWGSPQFAPQPQGFVNPQFAPGFVPPQMQQFPFNGLGQLPQTPYNPWKFSDPSKQFNQNPFGQTNAGLNISLVRNAVQRLEILRGGLADQDVGDSILTVMDKIISDLKEASN